MPLTVADRFGPFEIHSAIGAGGMGEVYRARDTKLNRDVALKVLPEAFAQDPERLARFRREAQVLAALNHTNIAAIHGFEESDRMQALVLEYVAGPTLADRIAQGPLPMDEALPIARQIAEALEAAHEQGIIHRDLKPANIKVTSAGIVKVLDFGLAKLADGGSAKAGREDVTLSPTITSPVLATGVGTILGTAAYMAPEQARGKAVDKRADIWAFGVILHEMVTGTRPFAGDTITDVLASIVKDDADLTRLPETVRGIVRACLEKDPAKRLRDIADLSFVGIQAAVVPPATQREPVWRRAIPLAMTALVAAVAVAASGWIALRPAAVAATRLSFPLQSPLARLGRSSLAISPDGRRIAYVSNNQLLLRDLGEFDARTLAGTAVRRRDSHHIRVGP